MKFMKAIINAFSSQPRQSKDETLHEKLGQQLLITAAMRSAYVFGRSAIEPLRESDFLNTYKSRPDAEHWKTIVDLVEPFAAIDKNIVALQESGDLFQAMQLHDYVYQHTKYIAHMLKAFVDGERFLIAKLSYSDAPLAT